MRIGLQCGARAALMNRAATIRQCGEKDGTAFTSWKPAVYFLPRQNCYILDINNQVSTRSENRGGRQGDRSFNG